MLKSLALLTLMTFPPQITQADMLFEPFDDTAAQRWTYVADGVMGGVSQGQAQIADGAVRRTGEVSLENNGGFIQVRNRFDTAWPATATALTIDAKGNGETYYVFLRTKGLARVWYSYRFAFDTRENWSTIEMPFAAFKPSHSGMPATFTPDEVISIGLVAYGKAHSADLTVREIALN